LMRTLGMAGMQHHLMPPRNEHTCGHLTESIGGPCNENA
jgi:hypothetical protein